MSCFDNRCNDPIDRKSSLLADLLDRGQGDLVSEALRHDSYYLSPREFNRLLNETYNKELKGEGDDLVIDDRTGQMIIAHTYKSPTNIYREAPPPPPMTYPQPQDRTTEDAIISGAVGAGIGAIVDRHNPGRGAAIGATSGIIGSIFSRR